MKHRFIQIHPHCASSSFHHPSLGLSGFPSHHHPPRHPGRGPPPPWLLHAGLLRHHQLTPHHPGGAIDSVRNLWGHSGNFRKYTSLGSGVCTVGSCSSCASLPNHCCPSSSSDTLSPLLSIALCCHPSHLTWHFKEINLTKQKTTKNTATITTHSHSSTQHLWYLGGVETFLSLLPHPDPLVSCLSLRLLLSLWNDAVPPLLFLHCSCSRISTNNHSGS